MVGQKILMGCRFLERRVVMRNSLFNRQLTGKKQAFEKFILWILKHCWKSIPLLRNICQKHSQFPTRDNRECAFILKLLQRILSCYIGKTQLSLKIYYFMFLL